MPTQGQRAGALVFMRLGSWWSASCSSSWCAGRLTSREVFGQPHADRAAGGGERRTLRLRLVHPVQADERQAAIAGHRAERADRGLAGLDLAAGRQRAWAFDHDDALA